jgi:hypothetical protein
MLDSNITAGFECGGKLVPGRRRSLGIDVLAPHLRSCEAVVGEHELLNLQER